MDELRERVGYQAFKAVGNYPAVADWGALADAILADILTTHRHYTTHQHRCQLVTPCSCTGQGLHPRIGARPVT